MPRIEPVSSGHEHKVAYKIEAHSIAHSVSNFATIQPVRSGSRRSNNSGVWSGSAKKSRQFGSRAATPQQSYNERDSRFESTSFSAYQRVEDNTSPTPEKQMNNKKTLSKNELVDEYRKLQQELERIQKTSRQASKHDQPWSGRVHNVS